MESLLETTKVKLAATKETIDAKDRRLLEVCIMHSCVCSEMLTLRGLGDEGDTQHNPDSEWSGRPIF